MTELEIQMFQEGHLRLDVGQGRHAGGRSCCEAARGCGRVPGDEACRRDGTPRDAEGQREPGRVSAPAVGTVVRSQRPLDLHVLPGLRPADCLSQEDRAGEYAGRREEAGQGEGERASQEHEAN
eukprot:8940596-Pyramimonas_sp.AAC.1